MFTVIGRLYKWIRPCQLGDMIQSFTPACQTTPRAISIMNMLIIDQLSSSRRHCASPSFLSPFLAAGFLEDVDLALALVRVPFRLVVLLEGATCSSW